ncbi:AfsR/SARP family transcriptional regulator [Glycomyces salinus]|uniref:AfsR/SARP family transcriptional regulator n=1 Tax=Glycomyces salinus TaxID=980294 RepID=UPI0018ED7ACB|nr:BTAD domain-containing putative transcriptional regulator [Glycomyces salinus]
MGRIEFGILGPVAAWTGAREPLDLKGPRHRALLARLLIARGRVVPVDVLVGDLWAEPASGALASVRTFVAALRRALEPDRRPRSPARLLVTDGPGYALRAEADAVDAWRFEDALAAAAAAAPRRALDLLEPALRSWRGPALAGLEDEWWAAGERARLEELRLGGVERRAEALLALDRPAEVVADLEAHAAQHPWREEAWRLLALALLRGGRQAEALEVARRASDTLRDRLGLDPGPGLRRLEADLLRRTGPADQSTEVDRVWAEASDAYDRIVTGGSRSRLESTVGLLRSAAVTGAAGLEAGRGQRLKAIEAAERLGDPVLTARVIGGFDVPANWTRSDDPALSARVVAAAERALAGLGDGAGEAVRARLLATVAVESRGTGERRAREAALEAERLARGLGDAALLAFALNGRFMQSFGRTGLAGERDAIGVELVALSRRHDLPNHEILGRLVRVQALSALADFAAADAEAEAADRLAEEHERPLVGVFTGWYRAMRFAARGGPVAESEGRYRDAAAALAAAGMPGVESGLLPLALLCLRVWRGEPVGFDDRTDWGPYGPWVRPMILLGRGRRNEAGEALRRVPAPPHGLVAEALWCLTARAAADLGDAEAAARTRAALEPAAAELAAGTGMLTAGPVADYLSDPRTRPLYR